MEIRGRRPVAAELRDDDADHPLSDVVGGEFQGTDDAGERTAAFDVGDEEDVRVGEPRRLDVRYVAVSEVRFRHAPRALGDDHVVCLGETAVGVRGGVAGAFPVALVVVARLDVTDRFTVDDELALAVPTGFEQHGIHLRRRRHARRPCLHVLRDADFTPLGVAVDGEDGTGVVAHVLPFERGDVDAPVGEVAAEPGHDRTLPDVAGGAGDEDSPGHSTARSTNVSKAPLSAWQ